MRVWVVVVVYVLDIQVGCKCLGELEDEQLAPFVVAAVVMQAELFGEAAIEAVQVLPIFPQFDHRSLQHVVVGLRLCHTYEPISCYVLSSAGATRASVCVSCPAGSYSATKGRHPCVGGEVIQDCCSQCSESLVVDTPPHAVRTRRLQCCRALARPRPTPSPQVPQLARSAAPDPTPAR